MMKALLATLFLLLSPSLQAAHEPWVTIEYPQDVDKSWWDDAWWDEGQISPAANHAVEITEIEYQNGDTDVPALLFRPKEAGDYLPVFFQHGRRGLDDLTIKQVKRIAARGFIVLAPDLWSARFIEKFPMEHDYAVEKDAAKGIDVLLQQPGVKGNKACIVSHTRGGYISLKALVTHKKQDDAINCYISYYPHWQDPNASEPMQVYRYATEIDELKVPTLVFLGEHDQYQRIRPIMEGIKSLRSKQRDAELIVYPGVGRGFDFRPPHVRTLADDLASKDAVQRAAAFIRKHLE